MNANKLNRLIELTREIEERNKLKAEYDKILLELSAEDTRAGERRPDDDLRSLLEGFLSVSSERKALEKREKSFRDRIKEVMGERRTIEFPDGLSAFIRTDVRNYIDREALSHDFGQSFIEKYSRPTEVEVLSVNQGRK